MTYRTLRLNSISVLSILAIALLAAGCHSEEPSPFPTLAPTGTPHEVEIPQIVWADGIEPTSELEDHPLVRAARQAELAQTLAWNTGDYASTLLMEHVEPVVIASDARSYSHQGDNPRVYVALGGWQPLEIVKYDENEGGNVLACSLPLANPGWVKKADSPGGTYDRSLAMTRTIRMNVIDGKLVYDTDDNVRSVPCDGSTVPVGFFNPEPELPPTPVSHPAVPPLFTNWEDIDGR